MPEIYDIDSADVLTSRAEDIYPRELFHKFYSFPSINHAIDYNLFARNKLELIYTQTIRQVLLAGELSDKYGLIDFIPISIIQEDDQFIGDIPTIELYAFGDSLNEVIYELREDIIDLYEELEATPNKHLSQNPRKWKAELRKLVYKK